MFAICVQNRGAEDLDVRKVYRILPDRVSSSEGHLRVIDESGEDYLYPADYFVFVELPQGGLSFRSIRRHNRGPGSSA